MKKIAEHLVSTSSKLLEMFQNETFDPSAAIGTPAQAKSLRTSEETWAVHGPNQLFQDGMWEIKVVVLSLSESENENEPHFILGQIMDRSETAFSLEKSCEYYFRAILSACNSPASTFGIPNLALPESVRSPRRPKKLYFARKSEELNLRKVCVL
jgi:hypothetical protein